MSDFNWKTYLIKGLKKVGLAASIGICTELIAFLGTEPVPTEYVWLTGFGVVIVEMILNGLKHSTK